MVDLAGLEPATFCMPCRRAPNCATSPLWCPWLDLNQQPPRCERGALPLRYKGVGPEARIELATIRVQCGRSPELSYTGRDGDLDGI